jgi:hypothetical protein
MWDQLIQGFIYMGMPVVLAYHLTCGNVFLNTAAEDATGFEKAGNIFLTPAQYLLNAKTAHLIPSSQGQYVLEQRFDYHNHLPLKSTFSIISLPFTLPIGCLLKGIGYMTELGKSHHKAIVAAIESTEVHPNIE